MTDAPHRVRLSRAKGWRKPKNTVVVARPTRWGNPWVLPGTIGPQPRPKLTPFEIVEHRADIVQSFAVDLAWSFTDPDTARDAGHLLQFTYPEMIEHLRGRNLACWCPLEVGGVPVPCHADVLLEWANTPALDARFLHEDHRRPTRQKV